MITLFKECWGERECPVDGHSEPWDGGRARHTKLSPAQRRELAEKIEDGI